MNQPGVKNRKRPGRRPSVYNVWGNSCFWKQLLLETAVFVNSCYKSAWRTDKKPACRPKTIWSFRKEREREGLGDGEGMESAHHIMMKLAENEETSYLPNIISVPEEINCRLNGEGLGMERGWGKRGSRGRGGTWGKRRSWRKRGIYRVLITAWWNCLWLRNVKLA